MIHSLSLFEGLGRCRLDSPFGDTHRQNDGRASKRLWSVDLTPGDVGLGSAGQSDWKPGATDRHVGEEALGHVDHLQSVCGIVMWRAKVRGKILNCQGNYPDRVQSFPLRGNRCTRSVLLPANSVGAGMSPYAGAAHSSHVFSLRGARTMR